MKKYKVTITVEMDGFVRPTVGQLVDMAKELNPAFRLASVDCDDSDKDVGPSTVVRENCSVLVHNGKGDLLSQIKCEVKEVSDG